MPDDVTTTSALPRELHAVFVDGEGNEPEYMCLAPQPEDPADCVAFSGNFRMVPREVESLWEELARRWNAHADLLAACEAMWRELCVISNGYKAHITHAMLGGWGATIAKAKGGA